MTKHHANVFDLVVQIATYPDGHQEIDHAHGNFKQTRNPVRTIRATGVLQISSEGIDFVTDERPDLLK